MRYVITGKNNSSSHACDDWVLKIVGSHSAVSIEAAYAMVGTFFLCRFQQNLGEDGYQHLQCSVHMTLHLSDGSTQLRLVEIVFKNKARQVNHKVGWRKCLGENLGWNGKKVILDFDMIWYISESKERRSVVLSLHVFISLLPHPDMWHLKMYSTDFCYLPLTQDGLSTRKWMYVNDSCCDVLYCLDLPPTQDSSGKWRFRLGFPTKNVMILVVTVTGWGVDLMYCLVLYYVLFFLCCVVCNARDAMPNIS